MMRTEIIPKPPTARKSGTRPGSFRARPRWARARAKRPRTRRQGLGLPVKAMIKAARIAPTPTLERRKPYPVAERPRTRRA